MTATPLHDTDHHAFASDNYAGVHPDVMAAIVASNGGHLPPYGADMYTERLREVIRSQFGERAEIYPVFNGTGANVVALSAALPRGAAVVAPATAHINTSEGAAPEHVSGIKILGVDSADGKLTADDVAAAVGDLGDEQRAQPAAVSITQVTELGTLYTVDEIRSICEVAHAHGMTVHVDGSRLWNAAAALDIEFRAFTTDVGVDVVSLGGTKNGALGAEAVLVLDPDRIGRVGYLRKASTQLTSKMRFSSAQFLALFDDDLGVRNARHANAMTARLRAALESAMAEGTLPGFSFSQESPANAAFARLPFGMAERIRATVHFYDWDPSRSEVRWMTAWDTRAEDVDHFVAAIIDAFAATADGPATADANEW